MLVFEVQIEERQSSVGKVVDRWNHHFLPVSADLAVGNGMNCRQRLCTLTPLSDYFPWSHDAIDIFGY